MSAIDFLSIVVPCFNEELNVGRFALEISKVLDKYELSRWELIFVDDGSFDKTYEVAVKLSIQEPRIRVVQHKSNKGYGQALLTGFSQSRGNWIFVTDADLQFYLDDLGKLLPFVEKCNFIQGFRIDRSDPFLRKILGNLYRKIVHWIFKLPVRDPECSFRLFRSDLIRSLSLLSRGAIVPVELIYEVNKKGAQFVEVGVRHRLRELGESNALTLWSFTRLVFELIKVLSKARHRSNPL